MATRLHGGPRTMGVKRDSEGHRLYTVRHLVEGAVTDGPANVLRTPGLPVPGAMWAFLADVDVWAWCRNDADVKIHQEKEGDPPRFWSVEQVFGTRPDKRCQDAQFEDPLLEPPRISGSFVKYTEEATEDRFGKPIKNSAHEEIHGPHNEWDANRPTVRIEQNVPSLQVDLFGPMIDTLNKFPLWGLPARCWKLSGASWERRYHGQCSIYYTRTFEFDASVNKTAEVVGASAAAIVSAGSGYSVGDTITLSGGTFGSPAVLVVTAISTLGGVIGVSVLTPGSYTVVPSAPVAQGASSGPGTGATFALSWAETVAGGWDRDLYDEGTKALKGHWDTDVTGNWILDDIAPGITPDPTKPNHFIRMSDQPGNLIRVILNGAGRPVANKISGAITAATNANPIVITSAAHGLSTGDQVGIAGVLGNTAANGIWTVTVVNANTFSLNGAAGNGTYVSGGTWENVGATGPGRIHVEKYGESDFLQLGLPILL